VFVLIKTKTKMSELLKWRNLMYNLANGISRLILAITFRVLYKLDLLAGSLFGVCFLCCLRWILCHRNNDDA